MAIFFPVFAPNLRDPFQGQFEKWLDSGEMGRQKVEKIFPIPVFFFFDHF
jgi:hypothetical protein